MDSMKEKIDKLLTLGQSCNEHEAAAAIAKAMELMDKYNISEDQLKRRKEEKLVNVEMIFYNTPVSGEEKALTGCLARLVDCALVVMPKKNQYHVFGTYSNIVRFTQFYRYAIDCVDRMYFKVLETDSKRVAREFQSGTFYGMCIAIKEVMDKRSEKQHGTEAGLIHISEQDRAERAKVDFYPNLLRGGIIRFKHGEAFRKGVQSGSKVGFNQQMSGQLNQKRLK